MHLTVIDNKWSWFRGRIQGKPYEQDRLSFLGMLQLMFLSHNEERKPFQNPFESNHLDAKLISTFSHQRPKSQNIQQKDVDKHFANKYLIQPFYS